MKRIAILAAVILAGSFAALEGCGGDSGNSGGSGGGTGGSNPTTTSSNTSTSSTSSSSTTTSSSSGTGGTMMNPPPPALGVQMDRMGRPAINTALNHTFDTDTTAKDAAKDAYNGDSDPSKWAASNAPEFAKNLAILDGLDTMCGNQLLAKPATGGTVPADRYAPLAGALADDRLWVKTDAATCAVYLAVEANATGVIPNADCGGRKLDYDVIDMSYSVLAAGAVAGVDDGVPADADTKGNAFPYLGAPH